MHVVKSQTFKTNFYANTVDKHSSSNCNANKKSHIQIFSYIREFF